MSALTTDNIMLPTTRSKRNKKTIIIGASSGIGKELALILFQYGCMVCATGRRINLLESLRPELSSPSLIRGMDVSDTNSAIEVFNSVREEFGEIDLVVISAGTGFIAR
ncbi:MAG: SDR family NAD(P)-dependent oxidoreductase [Candidatus Competibacteraceae bacterium]|nr:SDR family NAD(P)-dependent oxidoreductase [Candidatus Competibacteraceae bacterium]